MMTKQHAKDLSLVLWAYMRDNPSNSDRGMWRKYRAMEALQETYPDIVEILHYISMCPLCEVAKGDCKNCVLYSDNRCGNWLDWLNAKGVEQQLLAGEIYNKIKEWEFTEPAPCCGNCNNRYLDNSVERCVLTKWSINKNGVCVRHKEWKYG